MAYAGLKIRHHCESEADFLYDAERLPEPDHRIFDPQYWEARAALIGQASGRGTTWFVQHGGGQWALRHYHRGGFAARISRDRYFWLGLERTRAWREFRLTAQLHAQGLPVPAPVAARVIRSGLSYRADLITARLEAVTPLSQRLLQAALGEHGWENLGAVLRRFHDAGVDHADLNAHNILADAAGQFWLIDFDKGRLRPPGSWTNTNLQRLRRSLTKLKSLSPGFSWTDADWDALRAGYVAGSARTGRARS